MRFPGPGGTIAHAEIQIGDSVVIIEDEVPERGTKAPPPGGALVPLLPVHLRRGRGRGRRARRGAGRDAPASPQEQFYGDRDGHILDPFGHGGTVATHVEDVAPEELMRRMAQLQRQA
jgi:PhnB protein